MKVLARVAVTLAVLIIGTLAFLLIWANYRVQPLPTDARADKILVYKSQDRLVLLQQGKPLKVYQIALGSTPVGHKECEGDGRTPWLVLIRDESRAQPAPTLFPFLKEVFEESL